MEARRLGPVLVEVAVIRSAREPAAAGISRGALLMVLDGICK